MIKCLKIFRYIEINLLVPHS